MSRARELGMRMFSRAAGNVVDQGLSAMSNLGLSLVLARSLSAEGFGAFAIAFVVFGIGIAVTKAVVGQIVSIRHGASDAEELRRAASGALGASVLIGLLGTLGCLIAGLATSGQLRTALVVLAVILPVLLLQDTCRMVFFAAGRSWSAALIDGAWTVVTFGLLAILVLRASVDLRLMMFAWGAGALAAAVLGLVLLRTVPRLSQAPRWFAEHRDLTGYLLGEYVMGLGSTQIAILLVGVIATASAVGSLRASQVLLGPLAVVAIGAFQFAVPEIARRPEMGTRGRRVFGLSMSAGLGTLTVVYVAVLLLIPKGIGVRLFGDSWDGAASVLLAMGVSSVFSSLASGVAGVLYGMGQAPSTFRINLAKGPVLLVAVLLSAWLAGAPGAAWALAAVEGAVLPAWVWTFWRQTRVPLNPEVGADDVEATTPPATVDTSTAVGPLAAAPTPHRRSS